VSAGPGQPTPPPDHYSYSLYANPEHAGRFDQLRFSGPIGTLVAESQERVIVDFLPDVQGRSIIDVGTGTGRGALALARRGAIVTGVDASSQMLDIARQRADESRLAVDFREGDAHALAFADRSFDAAVCLRVLMHTPDWRRCLAELCRVARDRVVFDFPAAFSVAALQSGGRRAAAALGSHTEAYRVFRAGLMRAELARHGFRVTAEHRQFVLPIALHKLVGSRAFTVAVERGLAAVGLLRLCGSPVTVVAVRKGGR
jgi:SAM-dependent methyltransferase